MAIKSDKLLDRPSELHRRYGGRLAMQKSLQEKMVGGALGGVVLSKKSIKSIEIMRSKVTQIESILKGTLAVEKKELDNKKRLESGKRREKQEEKLETKPNVESGQVKMPSAPKLGILDWIKNFIGKIILGYFAVRLIDHLPKIMPIVKFLGSAADFIIDIGGKFLNGLVTFIDWGYKAYDATRGFLKMLGGENFAQGFDKFIGLVDNALFLTTVLAGSMALEALSGDDGGGLGDLVGDQLKKRAAQQAATSAAGQAGGAAQAGGLGAGAVAGIVAGAGLLASALGEGAFQVRKFAVKPIQKLENDQKSDKNPLTKIGRGIVLNMVRPLFGVFQAVGFLLDVVGAPFRYAIELIRYPFLSEEDKKKQATNLTKFDARIREDLRRALNFVTLGLAFKEKGSFGNIYGNKNTQKEMMGKMASGGVTRGGKAQGGVKRTIGGGATKKGKYKRSLAQKPGEVKITSPGADAGGEKKIFDFFGFVKETVDKFNPFNTIKKTGEELGKTDYFGPILAITSKITAGQEPEASDYKNVGIGINLLIAKGIRDQQLKGGVVAAFAEGGMVDPDVLAAAETGGDISNWVARTFQTGIESNAQKTLRIIRENAEKKKEQEQQQQQPGAAPAAGPGGGLEPGSVPGGVLSTAQLVGLAKGAGFSASEAVIMAAIAKAESGGNSNAKNFVPPDKSYGLWQINMIGRLGPARMQEYGLQREDQLFDPVTNAKAAYAIRKSQGLGAWTVYKTGKYRAHLAAAEAARSAPSLSTSPTPPGGAGPGGSYTQLANNPDAKQGSKLAGELGRFLDTKGLGKFGSGVHQHPEHPPWNPESGHSAGSLHYASKGARAIDIGGYGRSRGYPDQDQILAGIAEFNKLKGVKPVQLLKDGYPGHDNHVHVAYHRGKVRSGRETIARILKDETVLDSDTSKSLNMIDPSLVYKLNKASTKEGVLGVLQSYTDYEQSYAEPEIREVPVPILFPLETGGGRSAPAMSGFSGGGGDDYAESLYKGG